MSGFKSYKIRDGVHIPSKKYKEGWDAIFSDKPKKSKRGINGKVLKSKTDEASIAETPSKD
jgi:hypothetical protein